VRVLGPGQQASRAESRTRKHKLIKGFNTIKTRWDGYPGQLKSTCIRVGGFKVEKTRENRQNSANIRKGSKMGKGQSGDDQGMEEKGVTDSE